MGNLPRLPESATDYQAEVVELRQGQRKGWLKFGSFVILFAMGVGLVAGLVAAVNRQVNEVMNRGLQESRSGVETSD